MRRVSFTDEQLSFLEMLISKEFEEERWHQAQNEDADISWINNMIDIMDKLNPFISDGLREDWREARGEYKVDE